MNRRNILKTMALAGTGALMGNSLAPIQPKEKRVLRLAHLTDVHLRDADNAPEKFIKCLHIMQSLKDKPDMIFNGGDTIFDALGTDKTSVENQWQLWDKVIKAENDLPIVNCIGNHDVWGAGEKTDPLYGKKYALDKMGLDKPYHSFEKAGWKFIILDSTHPVGEGWYTAKLDDKQFDWFEKELQETPSTTPVMIMSHIPILTATGFYEGNEKDGNWMVPGGWMHIDFNRIKKLFMQHNNVKLCVSGHMHLLDKVEYNGVTYCCNGAVSGGWWGNEMYYETQAGFATIDLYEDGAFDVQYHTYSWS
ncbi:metallophosphoesterase family protein [Roseivirga sp.]|uniref:metallophosphoesterase family protein n=1 Tax=Roseivirga sp. TaxID=1964215 RepID=UPI002B2782D1|nr:metallophosphoesterase [Roseivirga sp.]